jgi:hypothetical protein
MRAPARAQDLILAHRVAGYRAGDLERRYPRLGIEEAYFINYGFLPRATAALLHPRDAPRRWDAGMRKRAKDVLAFVREHGPTRARDLQEHFEHGHIRRWGGDLNLSTHLLEGLHHRGVLRVARRESGTRVYEAVERPAREDGPEARLARAGRLVDVLVRLYAPLPARSLGYLCALLRWGVPELRRETRQIQKDAMSRYSHAEVDGVAWFWPRGENPASPRHTVDERLRFLTPFDPIAWDRRRFSAFWGWEYRFEAYLPAHRRKMGHYALPTLWGERMIGWANLKRVDGRVRHELGFAGATPRGPAFRRALSDASRRMEDFLGT